MPADFRKNPDKLFPTFLAILLGIVSIIFATTNVSANPDDVLQTQANKISVSQLLGAREAADYLQAIKQPSVLSAGFNPFNSREIKLSPNDFAASGELDQESLAPQAQGCEILNFSESRLGIIRRPRFVTTGDFNGDGNLDFGSVK